MGRAVEQGMHHKLMQGGAILYCMKTELELWKARRLMNHSPLVLLTSYSRSRERSNVMALAWSVPLSHGTPLIGVAVSRECFTHELISETREYAVNIPTVDLLEKVVCCGKVSGREVDKFRAYGLSKEPGQRISAPLIKECFACMELRVVEEVDCGDHTLFIGEVLRCVAEEVAMNGILDISSHPTLHHLGEDVFAVTRLL